MISSTIIGRYLRHQFVDHNPITTPAKLHCNSVNNKDIMEVGGGGAFIPLSTPPPKLFETNKTQSG